MRLKKGDPMSSPTWIHYIHILTDNHWSEVQDPYGRVRGRTEGTEGDWDSIGRKTVSINPVPSDPPETKPSTKEHT